MLDSSTRSATLFWCVPEFWCLISVSHHHRRYISFLCVSSVYVTVPKAQIYGVFFSFAFLTAVSLLSYARAAMAAVGRDARIQSHNSGNDESGHMTASTSARSTRVSFRRVRVAAHDSGLSADDGTYERRLSNLSRGQSIIPYSSNMHVFSLRV